MKTNNSLSVYFLIGTISLFFLLFISISNCSGCNDNMNTDKSLLILDSISNVQRNIQQVPPNRVKIFVDVSMSMQGFCRANLNYLNFLQDIDDCMFGVPKEYYSISNVINQTTVSDLLNETTYVSGESNFGLLSSNEIDENNLIFFITDLQFNSDSYYHKFSSTIRDLIYDGYYVNILGSLTDFNGLIFTDMNNECSNFSYSGKRPLYLIIVGNIKNKKYISDALAKTKLYEKQLPFYCSNDSYVQIPTTTAFNNGYFENSNGEKIKDAINLSLKRLTNAKIEIKIRNDIFLSWNNINERTVVIDGYKINPSSLSDTIILHDRYELDYNITDFEISNNEISFNLSLSKISSTGKYIMKINIIPDEETIPSWISDYSCNINDDCDKQKDHTLLLEQLIRKSLIPVKNTNSISTVYIFLEITT